MTASDSYELICGAIAGKKQVVATYGGCLAIEGISNVTVRDGRWHTASNYSRSNTCIDEIDVEVST